MITRDERLHAENDIARLIYSYCHKFDAADFEAVAEMFQEATWQLSPQVVCHGAAEKLAALREGVQLHDGTPGTRHMVTNIVTEVADDGLSASSISYVLTSQVGEQFALQLISQARYEDTFGRDGDGGWQFKSRTVHSDGAGDMSYHQR